MLLGIVSIASNCLGVGTPLKDISPSLCTCAVIPLGSSVSSRAFLISSDLSSCSFLICPSESSSRVTPSGISTGSPLSSFLMMSELLKCSLRKLFSGLRSWNSTTLLPATPCPPIWKPEGSTSSIYRVLYCSPSQALT